VRGRLERICQHGTRDERHCCDHRAVDLGNDVPPGRRRPPVEHRKALQRRVVVDAAEPKLDGVLVLGGRRRNLLSDERRPRPLV
jgi:hypothetical protein